MRIWGAATAALAACAALLATGLMPQGGTAATGEGAARVPGGAAPSYARGVEGGPEGPTPQLALAGARRARDLGERWAGTFWDEAERALIVRASGTTEPAATTAAGAPTAQGGRGELRVRPATYPLSVLRERLDRLVALGGRDVREAYVDARENAVILRARPGSSGLSALRAAAAGDPRVRVRDDGAEATWLSAGEPLVGGGAACTLGFTGTRSGVPVFLTAGHCGGDGLLQGAGRRGVVATGAGSTAPVRGAVPAPVGAHVCAMGASSGWACGPVLATDVTVRYGEGSEATYVRGLTKVGVCRAAGDSGGPWLWGTQAQGLTSGGAGRHGPGCHEARGEQAAYVAPIGPILSATGVVLDLESP